MTRTIWFICVLALLSTGARGDPLWTLGAPAGVDAPAPAFDAARIAIQTDVTTIPLRVELATTYEQRSLGLMDRTQLPANAGMLFLYAESQSPTSGFWMFRTRIPLDIAFLGGRGKILAVKSMTPCASFNPLQCPGYVAGVPYQAALEVNQGFFARHGISPGDRVLLPETHTILE